MTKIVSDVPPEALITLGLVEFLDGRSSLTNAGQSVADYLSWLVEPTDVALSPTWQAIEDAFPL
jgi:hypothetical protein